MTATTPRTPTRRRVALLRAAAILVGLSPFLLLEAGLRLAGWQGPDSAAADAYLEFGSVRPLFEPDGKGSLEIPASRQEYFRPESFAATKPPGEFRIFCLGGSTVQGRPYAVETSLTTWLELSLAAAEPERQWEVVNCGGVSYASYRLAPILQEVLQYAPDLIVLYTGHNEFLEQRSYGHLRQVPRLATRLNQLLDRSRGYRLLRAVWRGSAGPPADRLSAEVDAVLDYRGGLDQYERDDAWRRRVTQHYAYNVQRMIELARRHETPILVCNPVSDLSQSPPFKIQPGQLTSQQQARFERLWQAAHPRRGASLEERIALLRKAAEIDPRHAGAHYQLGKCLEAVGRLGEAKRELLAAKDEDVCPLRMLEPMHRTLLEVCRRTRTPLVDVRQLIEQQSPGGIPGERWMVDHVHPTIAGHQLIAEALMEQLQQMGVVTPKAGYQQRRQQRFQTHLESLDELYFAKAEQRLEGLRRWSQGRAFKVRTEDGS